MAKYWNPFVAVWSGISDRMIAPAASPMPATRSGFAGTFDGDDVETAGKGRAGSGITG